MKELHTTLLFIGFMVVIWPLPFWRYLAAFFLCMALLGMMKGS